VARFIGRNTYAIWFCPAISNTSAPSRAELNAGTKLNYPGDTMTEGMSAMTGFDSQTDFVAVPDGNSRFNKTIPGTISASNPTTEHYSDKVASPKQTALAEDTIGYLVCAFKGDVTGYPCQVWNVQIGSNNEIPTLDNTAHKFRVMYATLQQPVKTAVMPAP
jgi:hypothetical protein